LQTLGPLADNRPGKTLTNISHPSNASPTLLIMSTLVTYCFTPVSPWAYLGHARFAQIAAQAGARIAVQPVDFGTIFPVSGGLPLAKRAPQRQPIVWWSCAASVSTWAYR
jgi:hypothetical protein